MSPFWKVMVGCPQCSRTVALDAATCPHCGSELKGTTVIEVPAAPPSSRQKAAIPLDEHGQPFNLGYNQHRRTTRDICELLGLAKGILVDGVVTEDEVRFLRGWVDHHPEAATLWPVSAIWRRLETIFADGRVDEQEQEDLRTLLESLVGGTVTTDLVESGAATPFDDPPPVIDWVGKLFVLTGQFAYAERTVCAREVERRGGACTDHITRRTNYVVIGTFMSRDWKYGSFGTKIEKAIDYRSRGIPIRIVGEDHWAKAL